MDTIGPAPMCVAVGVVKICAVPCELCESEMAFATLDATELATRVMLFESPLLAPVVDASPDPSVVFMVSLSDGNYRLLIGLSMDR